MAQDALATALAVYVHERRDVPAPRPAADGQELVPIHRSTHRSTRRSRSALAMTDSELRVMAALAQMGLMRRPMTG